VLKSKLNLFIRDHKPAAIILFCALLIRIAYLIIAVCVNGGSFFVTNDTESFVFPARSLLQSGAFLSPDGRYDLLRTPGYPAVIAFMLLIFGNTYYYFGVIILQILLNLAAIYCLYKLCMMLTGQKTAAIIAMVLASLNFLDICYACRIMTDSITQSLLVFTLYYYVKYLLNIKEHEHDIKPLICGSFFLSLCVLFRPAVMYLPFALLAGIVFLLLIAKRPKRIISATLAVLLITTVPMGAWCLRNIIREDFYGYSSVSSINLYFYNSAVIYAKQQGTDYYTAYDALMYGQDEDLKPHLERLPVYDAYAARGMELIKSDLPTYAKYCAIGAACIFVYPGANDIVNFSNEANAVTERIKAVITQGGGVVGIVDGLLSIPFIAAFLIIDIAVLLALILFALMGIRKIKDWRVTALLLGVMGYMVAVSCQPVGYGSYPRFRLMISMTVILLASIGASQVKMKKIKKAKGQKTT